VIVYFVDIGGIVDNQFFNFLFIIIVSIEKIPFYMEVVVVEIVW